MLINCRECSPEHSLRCQSFFLGLTFSICFSKQVKPVLSRLKYTLVTLAASLFVCVLLFINVDGGQKDPYLTSEEAGRRAIPGIYNEDSARSFEPDAFCGEPDIGGTGT
uniref:Uncharacterized protein n=1 Tax=Rhizophora mucronata TaxID=61149 RepID=A0A2P2K497_RHIMU